MGLENKRLYHTHTDRRTNYLQKCMLKNVSNNLLVLEEDRTGHVIIGLWSWAEFPHNGLKVHWFEWSLLFVSAECSINLKQRRTHHALPKWYAFKSRVLIGLASHGVSFLCWKVHQFYGEPLRIGLFIKYPYS